MSRLRDRVRILAAQPQPLWFLVSRVLMRSGLCRALTIRQDGFRLRFYPSSLSAALWIAPRSRQRDAALFRRYLRPGDLVVDVGANIGTLAIVAALRVGSQGRVVAVEAHPRMVQYLWGNVALNGLTNVDVRHCALGAGTGRARMTDMRSDDHNRVSLASGVDVPLRRLDDLDLPHGDISLLKIDVEGYEGPVLEGGAAVLARTQCVYFESWERHFASYGYRTTDVLELLSAGGFHCLQRTSGDVWRTVSTDHRSIERENLLAVRSIRDLCQRTEWIVDDRAPSGLPPERLEGLR
jgi:FkbM family methyltransferase